MKRLFLFTTAVAAMTLASCTSTTRVVEVTPRYPSKPVYKPKPVHTSPSAFKVVNEYD